MLRSKKDSGNLFNEANLKADGMTTAVLRSKKDSGNLFNEANLKADGKANIFVVEYQTIVVKLRGSNFYEAFFKKPHKNCYL